ncbi:MAG: SO_0444 family Cu/Zn efflux transporter [Desulfobacteraceae bacterium]|nr:SO_0444 family Cu/Zn efflux transporter [Desulfobacteraceae bacterium]
MGDITLSQIADAMIRFVESCWEMLVEMAPYMCLGFFMAGLLHIFVNPRMIIKYLGKGRIKSVFYAAILGIPLPLCSCGVLPTVAGLKRQGANDGASMSFMIATPETGADSIAVTYALLDPLMTIFRPVAAFFTAVVAGLTQNFVGKTYDESEKNIQLDLSCKIDNCCDGINCPPEKHRHHHTLWEKLKACLRFGFGEILDDISKWLVLGIAIAGAINIMVPESFMRTYLDGGVHSMLIMLVVGIPFYICATSSTPIAAALILKGVSPGAALVFLLAGPATNAATISVVYGLFKKRAAIIYLSSIAVCAILMGLLLDKVYAGFNISASSVAGTAGEIIPHWIAAITAVILLVLIINSYVKQIRNKRAGIVGCGCGHENNTLEASPASACGCGHDHPKPVVDIKPMASACGCGHDHSPLLVPDNPDAGTCDMEGEHGHAHKNEPGHCGCGHKH